MSGAKLAEGWLELTVGTAGAQKSIVSEIGGAGQKAGKGFSSGLLGAVSKVAAPLAAAVGIGKVLQVGFQEFKDAAAGTAQLAAGIKSTGNAANVSVQGMNDLAASIQAMSGQTDDSIVQAQSLLLTFTNIKNVGADKIFDQATQAAADMAARMGGDAASKAVMLGKALNDPVRGIAALTRVGVQFTAGQKAQIQSMVKAGDTLGAQKVILAEINKQFGGSAAAFGNTLPGQVEKVKRSFEDFAQSAVGVITPLAGPVLGLLVTGLQKITPIVQSAADSIGPIMAGIGEKIGPALSQVGATLGPIFTQIGAAIGPVFSELAASFGPLIPQLVELWSNFSPLSIVFKAIGPLLPQLASAFGQLATSVGGALGQALQALLPVMQQLASVVAGALGQAMQALLPVVVKIIGVLGPVFTTIVEALVPIITQLAGIFGQLVQAVIPILEPILALIQPLLNLIGAILPPLVQLIAALLQPILALIQPIMGLLAPALQVVAQVLSVVIGWITEAITWFVKLVTGNKEAGAQFQAVWAKIMGFFQGIGQFFANIWNGLINGIAGFIGNVVKFFTSIPGKIQAVFAGAGKWLLNVGKNLIQGLLDGAGSLLRNIGNFFLSIIPDWIVGPFKAALGIHSPSTVFRDIGRFIGEGFIQGLKGSESKVQSAAKSMIAKIRKGMDAGVISRSAGNSVVAAIKSTTTKIAKAITEREKVLKRLTDKQKELEDLQKQRADFVSGVRSSIMGLGDISEFRSVTGMVANLTKQRDAAEQFRETLDQLTKLGLDATSRDQLLEQFRQTGSSASARALLAGGKDAVKQIADLQSQLAAQGQSLGNSVGDAMYKAGIQAAQGIVTGLQSQAASLKKVADGLADSLVKAVKKKLGIKSPSTVLAAVGRFTMQGFVKGVKGEAATAKRALTDSIPDASATRAFTSAASRRFDGSRGASTGAGDTFVLNGVTDIEEAFRKADDRKRRKVRASGALVVAGVA